VTISRRSLPTGRSAALIEHNRTESTQTAVRCRTWPLTGGGTRKKSHDLSDVVGRRVSREPTNLRSVDNAGSFPSRNIGVLPAGLRPP